MTLFARGLWCGWRGAIASPAAKRSRPRSEWKARPPMPTPHCCRNQRREASFLSASFVVIVLFFRNRFVEVEENPGQGGPGAALRRGRVLGAGQILDPVGRGGQVFLLRRQELEKHL